MNDLEKELERVRGQRNVYRMMLIEKGLIDPLSQCPYRAPKEVIQSEVYILRTAQEKIGEIIKRLEQTHDKP